MATNDSIKTTVADDVEITGTIKCGSNIRIDGKLNGDLSCAGNAAIGNSASIKGNLAVETVSVMGQVSGNIVAKDRIELKSTAVMMGDIRGKRLTVEDGVTFVGRVEVNPSGAPVQRPTQPGEAGHVAEDAASAKPTMPGQQRK